MRLQADRHGAGARRIAAACALVAVVAAGLGVHLLLPDTAATDIAGDALYAAAAYSFIVVLVPRLRLPWVGLIAGVWCVGIELFQLTGVPLAAGQAFPPAMLVLGTVFDPRDLVIYVVTVAVVAAVDGLVLAAVERGREH